MDITDFHLSFQKNRIFFDEETVNLLQNINNKFTVAKNTYLRVVYSEDLNGNEKRVRRWRATDIVSNEISEVRNLLKNQFRQLLSAENPNNQLEKKQ